MLLKYVFRMVNVQIFSSLGRLLDLYLLIRARYVSHYQPLRTSMLFYGPNESQLDTGVILDVEGTTSRVGSKAKE